MLSEKKRNEIVFISANLKNEESEEFFLAIIIHILTSETSTTDVH